MAAVVVVVVSIKGVMMVNRFSDGAQSMHCDSLVVLTVMMVVMAVVVVAWCEPWKSSSAI